MLALRYFPANSAYAFTFGGPAIHDMQVINLRDFPRFFHTRKEAVIAARSCGLTVFRNGACAVRKDEISFA